MFFQITHCLAVDFFVLFPAEDVLNFMCEGLQRIGTFIQTVI